MLFINTRSYLSYTERNALTKTNLVPPPQDLYSISNTRFFLREFFFSCDEDMLADPLTRVQAEYPDVQLGSYPNVSVTSTMNHLVKITFESDNREQVDKVRDTGLYIHDEFTTFVFNHSEKCACYSV